MNSVNCVSYQQPRTENRHKGVRHLANAAVTTAGVGATGLALKKGLGLGFHATKSATKTGKVFNFFEKMGQKIFNRGKLGGKIGVLEHEVLPKFFSPVQIKDLMTIGKVTGAMGIAAGVAALGLIARGIYKAGKINGEQ